MMIKQQTPATIPATVSPLNLRNSAGVNTDDGALKVTSATHEDEG